MGQKKVKQGISAENKINSVTGELINGKITRSTMFIEVNKIQFKNYRFVSRDEKEAYKAGWRAGLKTLIDRSRLCLKCLADAKHTRNMPRRKGVLIDDPLQRTEL